MSTMREVLYRAKPLKLDVFSEEDQKRFAWVYGCPLVNPFHGLSVQIFEQRDGKLCNWECDPKTLGQYTGLKDKNGKKIFEGDIVKSTVEVGCFVVAYRPEIASFTGDRINNLQALQKWVFLYENAEKNLTVIGNMHDNQELLQDDKEWRM